MRKQVQKKYTEFSVNDFVLDEFFCEWVTKNTPESAAFWEQWLVDHPASKAQVSQARSIVRSISFKEYSLSSKEVADLWIQIQNYKTHSTEKKVESKPTRLLLKVAATVTIFALAIFYTIYFTQNQYISYNTAFGETKIIVLPDSSTVTLNSNSILRFPSDWEERPEREVWIEGEGFFSVVHKSDSQRFKVHTDDGVAVEVLGTTFNVFHRIAETKVVLKTGKIRLSLADDAKQITMKPGDMVEYKQKSYSQTKVNAANYTAWTEKKLVLDHTSLRQMVKLLKDNYGIDVNVSSEALLNQTVSGSMPIVDAPEMVEQIGLAFQLRVVKEQDNYFFYEQKN